MTTVYDLSILLVEDNASLRRVHQRLLEKVGYRVRTAEDGADALSVLSREDFDVIVSDIGMPVMDGYELARYIRSNPSYKNKRLIALTAYSQPSLVQQARDVGFDCYLTKPINIADLHDAIHDRAVAIDYINRRSIESPARAESPRLRSRLHGVTKE